MTDRDLIENAAAGSQDSATASARAAESAVLETAGHSRGSEAAGPHLHLPELCLVVLVGISGSGKSTFAARAFRPYEVVSSDFCRGLVSGDENDQSASADAFEVLHHIVGTRLRRGLLTVVDATNLQPEARRQLVALAREHDVLPTAIVLDVGVKVATERHRARTDRPFGEGVLRRQQSLLRRSRNLNREGFRAVHVLHSPDQVDTAVIVRDRLRTDFTDRTGPFDIVGDVHGCLGELVDLLTRLGWQVQHDAGGRPVDAVHPAGRTLVLVGDLVDRGPSSVGVLRLVMGMHEAGHALVVPGNHDVKLVRALDGRNVRISHGLETTLVELERESAQFRTRVRDWCDALVTHLILDGGRLVVAHAGLKEAYQGRASGRVRAFALYGDTTGETDEYGLPVRYAWAQDYRGSAAVIYGHTPTTRLEWVNNTLCVDTGCVFGGQLTALRWPERETVQVPARAVHYEPARPLAPAEPERGDDELRLADVVGKRRVESRWLSSPRTITAEQSAGALEVMSRFALHPRLLPYLPPTMAPVSTSVREDCLEHPAEAFAHYAAQGCGTLICEEKHMGSRAVVNLHADGTGAVYTRTGRSFFGPEPTARLLTRVRAAAVAAGLFEELGTSWLLWDCELLPWSAKAEGLLREQYAPVGVAGQLAVPAAVAALEQAQGRGLDVSALLDRARTLRTDVAGYQAAWRRYVWQTEELSGVQLAPFQLLAADGATFEERDHLWHLGLADRLVQADPELFRTTRRVLVDAAHEASMAAGTDWWEELTGAGGEGMVVKPLANCDPTRRSPAQPGLKVRGREYLRIIYGPGYLQPANLERLRDRKLSRKRSNALTEYAFGLEGLRRLVDGEPTWRVHEMVYAVLALESEPIDPRL